MKAVPQAMAGMFPAKAFPRLAVIKPWCPTSAVILPDRNPASLPLLRLQSTMAAKDAAHEALEPSPKIPKLSQNGNHNINGEIPLTPHPLPVLRVKKLSQNAVLPTRVSALAAGYDLSSAVETKVPARGKALVATDLSIAIPEDTYARIAPRSGLAWKHSIDVGAGVIDADYRGPVGVVLFNHSDVDFEVKAGDRVAQLIIERIMTPEVAEVEDLEKTVRGAGGFGSTGL